MTVQKIKCTALRGKGEPCKAWAIHESSPPRCTPHSGITRAPKGNNNAGTHGYYRRLVTPAEFNTLLDSAADVTLIQETALLRVPLYRLGEYLSEQDHPVEKTTSISPHIISASRALAYIEKQLPNPNAIDWNATLDELAEELD